MAYSFEAKSLGDFLSEAQTAICTKWSMTLNVKYLLPKIFELTDWRSLARPIAVTNGINIEETEEAIASAPQVASSIEEKLCTPGLGLPYIRLLFTIRLLGLPVWKVFTHVMHGLYCAMKATSEDDMDLLELVDSSTLTELGGKPMSFVTDMLEKYNELGQPGELLAIVNKLNDFLRDSAEEYLQSVVEEASEAQNALDQLPSEIIDGAIELTSGAIQRLAAYTALEHGLEDCVETLLNDPDRVVVVDDDNRFPLLTAIQNEKLSESDVKRLFELDLVAVVDLV